MSVISSQQKNHEKDYEKNHDINYKKNHERTR